MAISFFALLDDVATLLDDISLMVKVATKKTAGVLGDDLALNANQLTELSAKRELPVIWEVTKGSLINKAILVPVALLLSAFLPAAVPIILMIGGAYLCFEGVEKVWHFLFHRQKAEKKTPTVKTPEEMRLFEGEKIQDAVRTDFILSAEIIVIALGSFVGHPIVTQIIGLSVVAVILTVAVYGVVAVIVKIDDVGLYWSVEKEGLLKELGYKLLWFAPKLLKALAYIGTVAMFVVGGHLWVENLSTLHHLEQQLVENLHGLASWVVSNLFAVGIGTIVGLILFALVTSMQKLRQKA